MPSAEIFAWHKSFKTELCFSGKQNLLTMWTNRIKSVHSKRHVEFSGRQETAPGGIAQLYQHMFQE